MGLHPARVARDLQQEVVTKLKDELDQLPMQRELTKIFDLAEILESSLNECADTQATWELEKATAPDTEAGRLAVLQAEGDHLIAERMRKHVTQDIEFWVKRYRLTKPQLEKYAATKTAYDQAVDKLCELQSVLDDVENELEDKERARRQKIEVVRLGTGQLNHPPEPSLAHRLTTPKKR